MPRDGSDVYSLPAGTEAVSGETASSADFNSLVEDIEADLNLDRPIAAGGTGASTAAGARSNLGIRSLKAKDTGGSSDAYTLTTGDSISQADGDPILMIASFTNTGAATINVDTNGATAIKKMVAGTATALAAGDIQAGHHYLLTYDSGENAWLMLYNLGSYATLTGSETLTNKTIALGSNSLSGTTAQFNTALTDGSFATLAGSETLTGKTIALGSNSISGTTAQFNTALTDGSFATLAGSETLTNKTIAFGSNTLTGVAPLASPTFTGTPAAPTAAADTNTTQIATTAYVQNELSDYAPLASPTFTGTLAAAAANFSGAVGLNGATTLNDQVKSGITSLTSSTSISVDMTAKNVQFVTLNHDATFTVSNEAVGHWVTLIVKQGATGGTGAWAGIDAWMGGSAPTLSTTTGEYDVISLFCPESGVVIASHSGPFA